MHSDMGMEQAQKLADIINKQPGWEAKAFLGMWPSEAEPGKYTGGWIVAAGRDGDDTGYYVSRADEWPILLNHLAAQESASAAPQTPFPCLCCGGVYLTCECFIETYERDDEWECSTHNKGGLLNSTPQATQPNTEADIQPVGGRICPIHNRPYMPLGWPGTVPALGEIVKQWACPVCAGTASD